MPLTKVTAATAAELCVFDLEEAKPLLQPQHTPEQFLDVLVEAGHLSTAVKFLAHALPAREAVWWGCLCARSVTTEASPPVALAALKAGEAWAYQPTEENRRAAEVATQAEGALEHAAGWAAQAAFWATGSISPAENPVVPPGPFFTATAVSALLLIGANSGPPPEVPQRLTNFLAWGRDIGAGGTGSGGG